MLLKLAYYYLYRVNYVEQELAKKRGRKIDTTDQVESELKRAEDELYKIPEHLKVSSWLFLYHPILFFYIYFIPAVTIKKKV